MDEEKQEITARGKGAQQLEAHLVDLPAGPGRWAGLGSKLLTPQHSIAGIAGGVPPVHAAASLRSLALCVVVGLICMRLAGRGGCGSVAQHCTLHICRGWGLLVRGTINSLPTVHLHAPPGVQAEQHRGSGSGAGRAQQRGAGAGCGAGL